MTQCVTPAITLRQRWPDRNVGRTDMNAETISSNRGALAWPAERPLPEVP